MCGEAEELQLRGRERHWFSTVASFVERNPAGALDQSADQGTRGAN